MADINTPPSTWLCQLCYETILCGATHDCSKPGHSREWVVLKFRDGTDGGVYRSLGTARATNPREACSIATGGHDTSGTLAFSPEDLKR